MRYKVSVQFHKDFVEVEGDTMVIGVRAKPERGKANDEVARKIAGYFGVPRAQVRIVAGARSRKKVVEVRE